MIASDLRMAHSIDAIQPMRTAMTRENPESIGLSDIVDRIVNGVGFAVEILPGFAIDRGDVDANRSMINKTFDSLADDIKCLHNLASGIPHGNVEAGFISLNESESSMRQALLSVTHSDPHKPERRQAAEAMNAAYDNIMSIVQTLNDTLGCHSPRLAINLKREKYYRLVMQRLAAAFEAT